MAPKATKPPATPPNKKSRWLIILMVLVAFLGFLDASYLTINHYTGGALECSILKGCEEVTSSVYATIFGVPVALFGVLYYLTVLILSLLYFDTRDYRVLRVIPYFTTAAFLASEWFVYLQIYVIGAICQYCMLSAITSTLLFILSLIALKYFKN